jgi:hypothetical protein
VHLVGFAIEMQHNSKLDLFKIQHGIYTAGGAIW